MVLLFGFAWFELAAAAYRLAVSAGRLLARTAAIQGPVLSIVPIALAYHIAHDVPEFPVAALQTAKALGDPFGSGLDLLGWTANQPPASIMMDHEIAALVYRTQAAIIAARHVAGVIVARAMAMPVSGFPRLALLSLLPLNAVMVLYTVFGLWLFSTPAVGSERS